MEIVPESIVTWQVIEPPSFDCEEMKIYPGRLELAEIPFPMLKPGQVLVEVAGCAICPRDAGYGTDTISAGPQSAAAQLSYEISGTVVAGDEKWLGKEVLVPARLPCGRCDFCTTGQGQCCNNPNMPIDNTELFSAFSSHVPVSSLNLFEIRNRVGTPPLEHFAGVIAELTTPFQAIHSASISENDLVIVIGIEAMGQYLMQIAKAFRAKAIIAVNIIPTSHCTIDNVADLIINAEAKDPETITTEITTYLDKENLPRSGWKIFNTAGNNFSLQMAYKFLGYADKLAGVDISRNQLKNVMKMIKTSDAQPVGACRGLTEIYPQILRMVALGKVQVSPFILTRPMSWIKEAFEEMNLLGKEKRIILTTDDFGLDFCPDAKSCR